MKELVGKYYVADEDYLKGWHNSEHACLFRLAVRNGRLLPFEINCSVSEGLVRDQDFCRVKQRSLFLFEILVYAEKKMDFTNN